MNDRQTDDQLWQQGFMGSQSGDTVWDADTEETLAEARARFATFGPILDVTEALHLLEGTDNDVAEVMAFGYGQEPEAFDAIGLDELRTSLTLDGEALTMGAWGPFAVWVGVEGNPSDPTEVEHIAGRHDIETDWDCDRCQSLYER